LLNYQDNYVEHPNFLQHCNKIILMVQQNYFQICIQQNFRIPQQNRSSRVGTWKSLGLGGLYYIGN